MVAGAPTRWLASRAALLSTRVICTFSLRRPSPWVVFVCPSRFCPAARAGCGVVEPASESTVAGCSGRWLAADFSGCGSAGLGAGCWAKPIVANRNPTPNRRGSEEGIINFIFADSRLDEMVAGQAHIHWRHRLVDQSTWTKSRQTVEVGGRLTA